MSITATPTAPEHHPDSRGSAGRRPSLRVEPTHRSGPPARSPVTLFEVPFASLMSDSDLALLARMLELSTREPPKLRPRQDTPGFARLDHQSGVFLKRGVIEGEWILEARTWGHPPAQSVHEWHVLAAGAAHRLDPTVIYPERLHASLPEIPDRPLGRAANKRLSRFRRRLVGLP